VILLTDDAGSRELAQTSVVIRVGRSWVQELERHNPGLSIRSSRVNTDSGAISKRRQRMRNTLPRGCDNSSQ
jgi:hypothetical protein